MENSPLKKLLEEAKTRNIDSLSITDHDSIGCQTQAKEMAKKEKSDTSLV